MNNLTLFLLGLVLVNIPACLSQNVDKQCFSLALTPSYPCCTGDKIVLSDESGDWGVENNKWCGIGDGFVKDSCFSIALKYPCCKSCTVIYTDESGEWGVENGNWCGIKDSCTSKGTDVQGNPDFDFSFLKLKNNKSNIVYSPLSIAYALKMLEEGAVGETYDEIVKVVGSKELPKYTSFEKYLSLANGLFIRDSYYEHIRVNYINTLKEKYNAEIIKDSFSSAANANKWIEEKTLGIIKNTLSDDALRNPDNIMLVINALALDMEWELQFTKDDTTGYTFYKEDGTIINATTMRQTETYSQHIAYYKSDEITVLTMNLKVYNGTQLEFMAIMPNNNNLSGYIENLTKQKIEEIDSRLTKGSETRDGVNIRIPKFKFDYQFNLKGDLSKMGMVKAFDKWGADFSKMSDAKEIGWNVYVSDGIHKAEIEFTEKGARAAAVTVFTIGVAKGLPVQKYPVDVIINKPFLFIIRDKNTKDIWFTGSVYEPNLWEKEKDEYLKPVSSPSSSSSPSPGISGTKTTKTIPNY